MRKYFEFGLWICPAVSRPSKCKKNIVLSFFKVSFDWNVLKNVLTCSKTQLSNDIVLWRPEKSCSPLLYVNVSILFLIVFLVNIESTSGLPQAYVAWKNETGFYIIVVLIWKIIKIIYLTSIENWIEIYWIFLPTSQYSTWIFIQS